MATFPGVSLLAVEPLAAGTTITPMRYGSLLPRLLWHLWNQEAHPPIIIHLILLKTFTRYGHLLDFLCWLFTIRDHCKKRVFLQTQSQGLRQLSAMLPWDLCTKSDIPYGALVSL